jgi:HEAT repeat protein
MTNAGYNPPVDKLLTYGDCRKINGWPNYLKLGLGRQHIPELIRMATDEVLHKDDPDSLPVWAPVHAWRALAQLRAEEAVAPLVALLQRTDHGENGWLLEEVPIALGKIGPASIPVLAAYLADESNGSHSRGAAARGLQQVAKFYPESRETSLAILAEWLSKFEEQDLQFNAFLIDLLVQLGAADLAPLMERAYAAGRVDETVIGHWEDVRRRLTSS